MDKELFKKRIMRLLDEGKEFTFESLPKLQLSMVSVFLDEPPPEWFTWVRRIETTIGEICKADSAPWQSVRRGVELVDIGKAREERFTLVKGYFIEGLNLALKALENDCYDELIQPRAVEVPTMKVTREGVFFAGQYYDALQKFNEIISQTQKSLAIIDGYVDESVLNILTTKAPAVEVNILTKRVSPALNTAASTFNKQYKKLSIRTASAFHDRFVIVDDKDFYHFGASIKDLGNRGLCFH